MEVALLPHKDLRALFSSNLVDVDAVHVFANRDDERLTFDEAFAAHRRFVLTERPDPHDSVSPRRNVLAFYGVGGIGKTTLSRQLQRRLTDPDAELPEGWPPIPPDHGTILTVRLDLSREAGSDVEGLVLLLRSALAPLRRSMTAFDLAFARYWERAHRESLGDYLRRHGLLQRSPLAAHLPQLIGQAVGEVSALTGLAGLGLLAQTGPRLVAFLRDRSRRRHVVSECRRLPDLLEADTTVESLSYYPHLLAWDLAQIQSDRDVSLVVFLDTFEEIGDRTNRDLERIIQRMVWLMPNVFFVVTGRNRLEWADPTLCDRLDWIGPTNWPGLETGAASEPRQHVVGFVSNVDSDLYLRRRLVQQGRPAIPEPIRRRIVQNARGLPLYLDLSVMRFLHILNSGDTPQPDDFDDAFPGVVARVFRDLDEHERTVLRAVSLLDSFDVELATVTAGLATDAPALQLIQRAFVQNDPGAPWPYHIHPLVREQVRAADVGLSDSWSATDWRHAGERATRQLGVVASGSRRRHDRRTLIAALNQGLRLAHDFDLPLDWLADGAYRFVEDSVWEPTLRPGIENLDLGLGPPTTQAHALAAGLVAIAGRQRIHRGHALAVIQRCLESGLLGGEPGTDQTVEAGQGGVAGAQQAAADLLAYFRAECQRDLGRAAESEAGMRALARSGSRMSDMALRGLSHVQRRRGRFRELRADLEQRPHSGVWHRVWGDLWWTQGRLSEAIRAYDQALDWAERERLAGEVATSAACRAWAAALASVAGGVAAVQVARQALERVTITWAELQVGCAEAVLAAGARDEVDDRCARLQAQAGEHGLTSPAAYAAFARAFHYAVAGDADGQAQARTTLRALVRGDEFAYLCRIAELWYGGGGGGVPEPDWLDDPQTTADRWQRIVAERRRELARDHGHIHDA